MGVEVVPVDAGAVSGSAVAGIVFGFGGGCPAGFQCSGLIDDAGSGEPLFM